MENIKKQNTKTNSAQISTKRLIIKLFVKLGIIALAIWVALSFVLSITIMSGNQMYPAIKDGDLVIALRLQRPYLNAAVLYENENRKCVGRVIGLPGSVIDISDNGALMVNGVIPSEEVFYPTFKAKGSNVEFPLTVGNNQVFILNDFRDNTNDSRVYGLFDMKNVQGNILLVIRRRGF